MLLPEPARVVVSARLVLSERCRHRMLGKVIESAPEVVKQQLSEIPAEAMANQDALHNKIAAVGGHGVRRHLPAAVAQAIGEIIEGEAGIRAGLKGPAECGQAAGSAVDHFERPQLRNFPGQLVTFAPARALSEASFGLGRYSHPVDY